MPDDSCIPERKHVIATETRSYHGHDLVEVAERIPGDEPTDASVTLSAGPTYETTYWRCRQCSQEQTHWSGFLDDCPEAAHPIPQTDGGFDPFRQVPNRVLKRAQYEAFAFSWLDGDVQIRNESHANPDDHEYVIRVEDGEPTACTCPADTYSAHPCKHRVAVAIRRPVLSFVATTTSLGSRL